MTKESRRKPWSSSLPKLSVEDSRDDIVDRAQSDECRETEAPEVVQLFMQCKHIICTILIGMMVDIPKNQEASPDLLTIICKLSMVDMLKLDDELRALAPLAQISKHFNHANEEDHNFEVEQGVATGLVKTLHRVLIGKHYHANKNKSRPKLTSMESLYVAVLTHSLKMVLRCSEDVLASNIHRFQIDLIRVIPKLADIFLKTGGNENIREVSLSSAVKIIGTVLPHLPFAQENLINTLVDIFQGMDSNYVRVDAATSLVKALGGYKGDCSTKLLLRVEADASLLISTISTASFSCPQQDAWEAMDGLYHLARLSHVVRNKMAKRRCTILAVVKDLENENFARRKGGIEFAELVLTDIESSKSLSFGFADNAKILLNAIVQNAIQDPSVELQGKAINVLANVVPNTTVHVQSIIDTFRMLIYEEDNKDILKQASIAFCQSVELSDHELPDIETTVDLMSFEDQVIRSEAIRALATMDPADSKLAMFLLQDTDFLSISSKLLGEDSFVKSKDCTALMDMCRQYGRYPAYHKTLGMATGFLDAIVQMIVDPQIKNRKAHYYGVEVVIDLLSQKENVSYFLPYKELLPWLISFVNATTTDDHFKKEVVRSIIRLSATLLK